MKSKFIGKKFRTWLWNRHKIAIQRNPFSSKSKFLFFIPFYTNWSDCNFGYMDINTSCGFYKPTVNSEAKSTHGVHLISFLFLIIRIRYCKR